jgi:RES domain-containing protein
VTVSLWRIASDTLDWLAEDLNGKGAAARGARWNFEREAATYASTSIALAAWEARAHLGRSGVSLPFNRYLVRIDVPEAVWAERATVATPLPVGWDAIPEGRVSRTIGSGWLASGQEALLVVPSVVIPEENNVLINPVHADSAQITSTKVRRFLFDHRV